MHRTRLAAMAITCLVSAVASGSAGPSPSAVPIFHGPAIVSGDDQGGGNTSPRLAFDSHGSLHLLFSTPGAPCGMTAWMTSSADHGESWTPPIEITADAYCGDIDFALLSPSVSALAHRRTVYVDGHRNDEIRFATRTEGGVGSWVRLDDANPGHARHTVGLCVADGVLICTWKEDPDGGSRSRVAAVRSPDGGSTWSTSPEIVDNDVRTGDPGVVLAPGSNGTVYATYAVGETRLFRTSAHETTWIQTTLPVGVGETRPAVADVAVSADGTIGLAYGPRVGTLRVAMSVDGASSWSTPTRLYRSPTDPGIPNLVSDNRGGWHCAWGSRYQSFNDCLHAYLAPDASSWTERVRVNPDLGALSSERVSSAVDADGHLYLAYAAGASGDADIEIMTTRGRGGPAHGLHWLAPRPVPNPSRATVTLLVPAQIAGAAHVRLLDLRGRVLREWADVAVARGVTGVTWDGRVGGGGPAAAGVYFWDVTVVERARTRRMTARTVYISP